MAPPENAYQVFALLDKTNCKKCGEKTCLAFAGAVYQGRRVISDCPTLAPGVAAMFSSDKSGAETMEEQDDFLEILKQKAANCDLEEAAIRTGGRFNDDRLTVKILGKDFSVDTKGNLFSDLHVISWISVPFLTYVLECRGHEVSGDWISFRELRGGKEKYPLFEKRCEQAMKRVADTYTDLFDDLVHLFQGREVGALFESDISVVLPVLPRVPLMICYWKADEGLESSLNIFFNTTVDANLGIDSVFSLGAGLALMFEKLALRHGAFMDSQ